ncbi:hypothetical protein Taro_013469 [Colocasia esculenta]|uniref:UBC core domain-containing protein n=1 Tax=Colocasia esculenta TaxID=4460 RepID=A0A843UG96_COLES|nr:hypothetical protein [Colocasia esculenta]
MGSSLSKIACNRLQKELSEWQVNPPAGFKHKVTDNLQRWIIEVVGAPGTLYASETYQLQVDFPEHYPMEAPQVQQRIGISLSPFSFSIRRRIIFFLFSNNHIFVSPCYLSSSCSTSSSHLQQWAYMFSCNFSSPEEEDGPCQKMVDAAADIDP